MNNALQFVDTNKQRILDELIEFLKIPSVSNSPKYADDTKRCAAWAMKNLKAAGLEHVELIETEGYPVIYGDWLNAGADKPTVLIYGHYDVQPVDPIEKWDNPPFEPVIKGNTIFGRGTADDKGQVFVHFKAIEAMLKTNGKLPCNVKFMVEGEEECGSNHLEEVIRSCSEKLKCDYAIVSDTEWFAAGLPTICYALRGLSFGEVTVTGPNRDLHSGTFGGAVDNPINVLCRMMAKLTDENGKILIPGLYDNVLPVSEKEHKLFSELPYNEEKYMEDLGVEALNGEKGYTTLERAWARPSIDINGIYGGYTGEGAKTVITTSATAKISLRLVANQSSMEVSKKLEAYLRSIAPKSVKVDYKYLHGAEPVLVELDSKPVKTCEKALEQAFGKKPVYMREGGSIGIVELFGSVLKAPTVLMGLGLPTDNIHSPNENYSLDNFFGGIRASIIFLDEIAK